MRFLSFAVISILTGAKVASSMKTENVMRRVSPHPRALIEAVTTTPAKSFDQQKTKMKSKSDNPLYCTPPVSNESQFAELNFHTTEYGKKEMELYLDTYMSEARANMLVKTVDIAEVWADSVGAELIEIAESLKKHGQEYAKEEATFRKGAEASSKEPKPPKPNPALDGSPETGFGTTTEQELNPSARVAKKQTYVLDDWAGSATFHEDAKDACNKIVDTVRDLVGEFTMLMIEMATQQATSDRIGTTALHLNEARIYVPNVKQPVTDKNMLTYLAEYVRKLKGSSSSILPKSSSRIIPAAAVTVNVMDDGSSPTRGDASGGDFIDIGSGATRGSVSEYTADSLELIGFRTGELEEYKKRVLAYGKDWWSKQSGSGDVRIRQPVQESSDEEQHGSGETQTSLVVVNKGTGSHVSTRVSDIAAGDRLSQKMAHSLSEVSKLSTIKYGLEDSLTIMKELRRKLQESIGKMIEQARENLREVRSELTNFNDLAGGVYFDAEGFTSGVKADSESDGVGGKFSEALAHLRSVSPRTHHASQPQRTKYTLIVMKELHAGIIALVSALSPGSRETAPAFKTRILDVTSALDVSGSAMSDPVSTGDRLAKSEIAAQCILYGEIDGAQTFEKVSTSASGGEPSAEHLCAEPGKFGMDVIDGLPKQRDGKAGITLA